LKHLPRYVTQAERGRGFAEVARALLAAHTGIPGAAAPGGGPGVVAVEKGRDAPS